MTMPNVIQKSGILQEGCADFLKNQSLIQQNHPSLSSKIRALIQKLCDLFSKFLEQRVEQRAREKSFRDVVDKDMCREGRILPKKDKILEKLSQKLKESFLFQKSKTDQSNLPDEINKEADAIHKFIRGNRLWGFWDKSLETAQFRGKRFEEECFLNLKLHCKRSFAFLLGCDFGRIPYIWLDEGSWYPVGGKRIDLRRIGLEQDYYLLPRNHSLFNKWRQYKPMEKLIYPVNAIIYDYLHHDDNHKIIFYRYRMYLNYFLNCSYEDYINFREVFQEDPGKAVKDLQEKLVLQGEPFFNAPKNLIGSVRAWCNAFNVMEKFLKKSFDNSFVVPLFKKVVKKFDGDETAALRYLDKSFSNMKSPLNQYLSDERVDVDIFSSGVFEVLDSYATGRDIIVGDAVHPDPPDIPKCGEGCDNGGFPKLIEADVLEKDNVSDSIHSDLNPQSRGKDQDFLTF